MKNQPPHSLAKLEILKTQFDDNSIYKLQLLKSLDNHNFKKPEHILRLHETLCFIRAYPDNPAILNQTEKMLNEFSQRNDLKKHNSQLINSGIAGTTIQFRFFAATAIWLTKNWPANLTIDWDDYNNIEKLEKLLPHLVHYSETPGLDEYPYEFRQWINLLKNSRETDAAFLIQRLAQLPLTSKTLETLLDELDIPLIITPGNNTPSRTTEKYPTPKKTIHYQHNKPLTNQRPSLINELQIPPRKITQLSPVKGHKIINLARTIMATRSRDLDAFAYGDKNDVQLIDCGNGLQFAINGVIPERRFLLEILYGFMMLKNGVPVGYGTYSGLFNSCEIAFTVFDTYRSAEAAYIYTRALAIARHIFNFNAFSVIPYQLGYDNEDAIQSGAWWFYQKLGFKPLDKELLQIMQTELNRIQKNKTHRSTPATLRKLSSENVYLYTQNQIRNDITGLLPLGNVGLKISKYLAKNFGYDRNRAEITCTRQARKILNMKSTKNYTSAQIQALNRWSPLVLILPNIKNWPTSDKHALIQVIKAKGNQKESDFLHLFDNHKRLRLAITQLAQK